MLEDFGVCSFDCETFRACENQFLEYLFDHSMYFTQGISSIADLTLPFSSLCYFLGAALMTVDLIALRAFLRLVHDKATYLTHEMFNYIGQLRRNERRRLYIQLHIGDN